MENIGYNHNISLKIHRLKGKPIMNYSKKVIISIIIIILIISITINKTNSTSITLFSDNNSYYIKIHEDKVILYDKEGHKIDFQKFKQKILDFAIGNIDDDYFEELVILTKRRFNTYGSEIVILKLDAGFGEAYREDFSELKPWKVATGDIDGDGRDEISIGVYKETPLHKIMAKRPFIYYFKDSQLLPKWRGSRLSKPFDDYDFYDIDKDGIDETISIEKLENGRKIVNTYKWRGFGFEGYMESQSFEDIKNLRIEGDCAYVNIEEDSSNYQGVVKIYQDILGIERVNSE